MSVPRHLHLFHARDAFAMFNALTKLGGVILLCPFGTQLIVPRRRTWKETPWLSPRVNNSKARYGHGLRHSLKLRAAAIPSFNPDHNHSRPTPSPHPHLPITYLDSNMNYSGNASAGPSRPSYMPAVAASGIMYEDMDAEASYGLSGNSSIEPRDMALSFANMSLEDVPPPRLAVASRQWPQDIGVGYNAHFAPSGARRPPRPSSLPVAAPATPKRRRSSTSRAKEVLSSVFRTDPFPSQKRCQGIAQEIGWTQQDVLKWFERQRGKAFSAMPSRPTKRVSEPSGEPRRRVSRPSPYAIPERMDSRAPHLDWAPRKKKRFSDVPPEDFMCDSD
ncbi:hypothetical protein B0H21DRAFT_139851 [Amylocystis lapponica]|nr:hypothetical protein B0H21DRAFT_139851 [Amylocystis lapponica]